MKKRFILLVFILIIISLIAFIAYSNYIKTKESLTGETVTGEATDANFAVSVSVIAGTPNVTIILPENETYITNENLRLNFTASNVNTIWYNLDQGTNITITENTTFNTTEGIHTLYLYANTTDGNETSDNITFSVNSSKFRVIYNEYAGNKKGSSTDFNKSSYEDLQDLSGIILENTNWGKISFNENINVTNDVDASDKETDLDTNTNISENRIELDSAALPNFNKSAILSLYNLTFDNPRILKDSSVCPETICTEISYSDGTLVFSVTQFTTYSAEETPSAVTPGGGAAEGGGGITTTTRFVVTPEEFHLTLKQGEAESKELLITNTGNSKIDFSITNPLPSLIRIGEESFSLESGKTKTLILDFIARETTLPDAYVGILSVKGNSLTKEIPVVIEVETKKPLFDVRAEIPKQFLDIKPGEELPIQVYLFNLGDIEEKVDVKLTFSVKDENNNLILSEHDTLAVETQASYIKNLKIPESVSPGRYLLYINVAYQDQIASTSLWFSVSRVFALTLQHLIIIVVILLVIILFFVIYKTRKIKKHRKHKRISRIDELVLARKKLIR